MIGKFNRSVLGTSSDQRCMICDMGPGIIHRHAETLHIWFFVRASSPFRHTGVQEVLCTKYNRILAEKKLSAESGDLGFKLRLGTPV